jgi:subtilisin family serine protease
MFPANGPVGGHRGLQRSVVSPALQVGVPVEVRRQVVPVLAQDRSPVLVELDLTRDARTEDTRERFVALYEREIGGGGDRPGLRRIADSYVACVLSPEEVRALVAADREAGPASIFRVWPDYRMRAHIDRSVSTIKSDAAFRSYRASGEGVTWAILDSGIQGSHPHFAAGTLSSAASEPHKDFTGLVPPFPPQPAGPSPLEDPDGHGTHVAGIIAGALPDGLEPVIGCLQMTAAGLPQWISRKLDGGRTLAGMAPKANLVSLKVLAPRDPDGLVTSSSAVIEALYYVRETVNSGGRTPLLIHGVNMSFGCPWDPRDYACGQSPVCREVDLLAGTGVVVVVSAGNDGYAGETGPAAGSSSGRAVLGTITDPGNAEGAITVGSTHRDSPHVFGVTYLSSKGPTLDGRLKPDLLAPGERITSCAAGSYQKAIAGLVPPAGNEATYTEETGTSMAAPHVSGAVAAFLSVRPEYIGRPRQVKEVFCANATSLGRDRYLEGHGLIDLMRVLSNV